MDRTVMELAAVEDTLKDAANAALAELRELQLAFVGGGAADPIFF